MVTDSRLVATGNIHCVYTACVVPETTFRRITSDDLVASSVAVSISLHVDTAKATRLVTIRCKPSTSWANCEPMKSQPNSALRMDFIKDGNFTDAQWLVCAVHRQRTVVCAG